MAHATSEGFVAASSETEAEREGAPGDVARPLWRRIGGVIGLLLACFIALELTCRIEEWVEFGVPLDARATSIDDLLIHDEYGVHGRPNAQFQRWRMNSLGMRGREVSVARPPGTLRVVVVGASESFGLYESQGKDYPTQLEDSLRAELRRGMCTLPGYHDAEVLNTSFPGMSLPTIEQDLRMRVARLHPDIVVIYPAPVSYLDEQLPARGLPTAHPTPPPPWYRALYPRVIARIRTQVKELLPQAVKTALRRREARRSAALHAADWQYRELPTDRLSRFESDLTAVIATSAEIGATPMVVTHANIFVGRKSIDEDMLQAWQKFYPRAPGPMIIAFDSAARQVEIATAERAGAIMVDATPTLARMPTSAFADFVHFSDAGSSRMAGVIANGICRMSETPVR